MQDKRVVVASYLVVGLTEEDLHYLREHLLNYGRLFITDEDNLDVFKVELINDTVYPVIALKVDADVWERFSRSHDLVEYSIVMAQNGILGELH